MLQIIEANWVAFALVLLIGLIVAWWLFRRASQAPDHKERRPDVLDEGAAPAQRNQALIDAPSAAAAALGGTNPDTPAGAGEVVGTAVAEEAAAVPPPRSVPPAGEADDLTRIKGLGPKLVTLLHSLGVTRYEQIAAWTEDDIDRIDPQLGAFAGRIRRDSWVTQAGFLATGDSAGFEAKFGKL